MFTSQFSEEGFSLVNVHFLSNSKEVNKVLLNVFCGRIITAE
jgi:hypothetical protein